MTGVIEIKTLEGKRTRKVKVLTTPRGGLVAVPGKVWLSCDYSAQEIRTAAAYSKDAVMVNALLSPKEIVLENGEKFKNPDADLHTLTAVQVCYRDRLIHLPRHEWVSAAESEKVNAKGESARFAGKKYNFTALYFAAPPTLGELMHIPLELAKEWSNAFQALYSGYYEWGTNLGKIAEVRGYQRTSWLKRQRWVGESNAKGVGESPARTAVNFTIQGECANQCKVSLVCIEDRVFGTEVELLPPVHDETNLLVPGECYLDEENSKWKEDVLVKPKYVFSEEAIYWQDVVSKIMEEVQTECFERLGSEVRGLAEASMAPFWAH